MHEYPIREERNMDDFEWLFAKLGDLWNRMALPNFPANEQRVMTARRATRNLLYNTDQYNTLIKSLRLELEKAQIRTKVNGLHDRQKKQTQRRLPAHNSVVSNEIANDFFIVHSYGVFQDLKDKIPRELVDLHADFIKIQEPELVEREGDIGDDEWMKLAKECEHWTSNRANKKREDKLCCDEDARYEQEHEYVRLEAEARPKKVNAVKADLLAR
ncbi:unnamed protein product [Peronospora effusa]|nr:unnamed protein product [Peronospora effusa]